MEWLQFKINNINKKEKLKYKISKLNEIVVILVKVESILNIYICIKWNDCCSSLNSNRNLEITSS